MQFSSCHLVREIQGHCWTALLTTDCFLEFRTFSHTKLKKKLSGVWKAERSLLCSLAKISLKTMFFVEAPQEHLKIKNSKLWKSIWWMFPSVMTIITTTINHRKQHTHFAVKSAPSWRRKWQPSSVFMPGNSHGQRSLVGYGPWGCKKVGQDLATKQQNNKNQFINCNKLVLCHINVIC